MPRAQRPRVEIPLLDQLLAVGEGAPSTERKIEIARHIRSAMPDAAAQIDMALFEQQARMARGVETAQTAQQELRSLLDRLDAPPWHPALFLGVVPTDLGPRAMVQAGGTRRVVAAADGIDLDGLVIGEEVFLATETNILAGRSPYGTPRCGETAFFERTTADGRCVLRWRDEEVLVEVAGTLDASALRTGDQVRWDRAAWMVFEKVARGAGRQYFLDEIPDVRPEQVGGQEENLALLLASLTATLVAPERARRYGLGGRRSILMVGPPGCGKTLMARIAAAEVTRLGGQRCRFAVVKPAEWESPWVGEAQQNIRDCFRALREASDDHAVLFLDEIESIGRIRGGSASHHSDKFLAALLAEIDGFRDRAGIAIIAATNRKDLVDPALLERLSDVEITVRRPDMRGARAILDIHLADGVPIHSASTREELIEVAVTRLYSPNAQNELCRLKFRDGKFRTLVARELVSGRLIAQICRAACLAAFLRDVRGGEVGVRVADMEEAAADAMERLASTLSRHNVHSYLADLPQDHDVVAVEQLQRKVVRPHRYRHAA